MIQLVGFAASNYYCKVKLALLEKQIEFTEELNWARKDEATLSESPLGKVPFIRTEQGPLCESQVIIEYLEDAYPQRPLIPADPFAAAKVRELSWFLDVHLELVARRGLYGQAFFGKTAAPGVIEQTRPELERNIAAFARLAKFAPYIAGDTFTVADCVAAVHLPVITIATKRIYGEDLLAALPVKPYMALLTERKSVQQVTADRKENAALMASRVRA
jgi:glutathione S-transferase